jgi:hypothetical protein
MTTPEDPVTRAGLDLLQAVEDLADAQRRIDKAIKAISDSYNADVLKIHSNRENLR